MATNKELLTRVWQQALAVCGDAELKKHEGTSKMTLEQRYQQGKADALRVIISTLRDDPDFKQAHEQEFKESFAGGLYGMDATLCPHCWVPMDFKLQTAQYRRWECPKCGVNWMHDWRYLWKRGVMIEVH